MRGIAFSPRFVSTARNFAGILVGFLVGLILTSEVAYAQTATKNITIGDGFNVCQETAAASLAEAQALTVRLTVDKVLITVTPTWEPAATAGNFRLRFPADQFPAAQRTLGRHDYTLEVGGVVLADGSTAGITTTNDHYIVVNKAGPTVTPPKWIRVLGTIVATVFGKGWLWLA